MGAWNDSLWPLIVLTDDRKYNAPVAISNRSASTRRTSS